MTTKKRSARKLKRFWLSYDLGLRGDYSGLYEWLDSKGAEECGDSVATFVTNQTKEELEKEIKQVLTENTKARVYLIAPNESGKFIGKFLMGKRKSAAPWTGFFETAVDNALDQ